MSLLPYYGEFGISPFPLELDLNYCSHGCAFCFANLGNPTREADIPSVMRLLSSYRKRTSPEARLLQMGYPVLVSNKVDPFANSNDAQALPLLEVMTELGIPIGFQTRGGRRVREALRFLRPAVWYISFDTPLGADDVCKAIEPGAPTVGARLDLIRELRAAGHRVVAALNPLVPEWLPDPAVEALLAALKDAGAEGVWMELLHLNRDQAAAMSDRQRAVVSLPVIQRAGLRKRDPGDVAHLLRARAKAAEIGLATYTIGQAERTDFWRPYHETYPRLFPIQQDAVNWCWDHLEDGDVLAFDDFLAAFQSQRELPAELVKIDSYIRAKSRGGQLLVDLLRDGLVHAGMTWREAMAVVFAEPRLSMSPSRTRCFAYAAERGANDWTQLVDEDGFPFLVFTRQPHGTDDYYADVRAAA